MNITQILSRLQGVTRNGDGWKALCPAHDDQTPSLSIMEGDDGRTLLKCHAGCSTEAICAKLNLTLADLFADNGHASKRNGSSVQSGFNWQKCVSDFSEADAQKLATWRGLSGEFVRWLHTQGIVGIFEGKTAFANHGDGGNVVSCHVRLANGKWKFEPTGQRTAPLVFGNTKAAGYVLTFESQWDAFAVMDKLGWHMDNGLPDTAAFVTRGAGNGKLIRGHVISDALVYVFTQNDAAAQTWLADITSNAGCKILNVATPTPHKDANDWTRAGATRADLEAAMKTAKPIQAVSGTPARAPEAAKTFPTELSRPLRVEPPETPMDFKQWQAVISANFLAYARPAEICASVVAQLLLNDVANPFALALVDVPSSGKTITLNFFDVPDLAYTTDNFTPASFVSHARNVKREELAKVDMLPRIRYRTLIVRDLAPIFGVKEDELLKTMGILTRALDGEGLETDSGVHGKRGYKGDYLFMLLAGTTPIPPRVFKVMGTLGSRLFFLALHSNIKSHDELIAQNRGAGRREKERACRDATDLFLRTLWTANPGGIEWNKDGDPDDYLRVIARCAELLAALRGAIQMWQSEHDGSVSHNVPVIEQPDRINCLLYNLARGHALLCGRTQLATADLAPVLEVTFDSAPTIRSKVFRGLLEQGGTLKTSQVEKLLRCSKPTALKEMEALAVLGVADKTEADPEYGRPEHELRLAKKFEWFATDERKALCWPSKQAQGGNP
jgi:predicted transcriptional regulator